MINVGTKGMTGAWLKVFWYWSWVLCFKEYNTAIQIFENKIKFYYFWWLVTENFKNDSDLELLYDLKSKIIKEYQETYLSNKILLAS